ncbi:family 43 glycosylhydrolase [uncultured Algibacter sp.]|uniref:glycoside hydrolase family 117 protein n=1 Tax=uncultured Algibacter sp. TaxID=298659 RepID=UPI002628FC8B|nr:family 43 glycosylhydrolase [uncultured Algibacter sp.]
MNHTKLKLVLLIGIISAQVCFSQEEGKSNSSKPPVFPAIIPVDKPTDRSISTAMHRLYDHWGIYEDRENELFSNFGYSEVSGFNSPKGLSVSRRDPSKILLINGKYYVWYTKRETKSPPTGSNRSHLASDVIPSADWDLAEIWYATSKDGYEWKEEGVAVPRPPKGELGWRSVSTPDVLAYKGKYYLYYQAFNKMPYSGEGDRAPASVSIADSPDGPWKAHGKIVVDFGAKGEWDEGAIHDPYPLVYNGKIYIYYKGGPYKMILHDGTGHFRIGQGVAISESPLGPFEKHPLNPVLNSGHETGLFPFKGGVAAFVSINGPEKNTIQYAPDGVNFEIASLVVAPPIAVGPYIPNAFADDGNGRGITWGLAHTSTSYRGVTHGQGVSNENMLIRFDCDLSLDVNDPEFKRHDFRFRTRTLLEEFPVPSSRKK